MIFLDINGFEIFDREMRLFDVIIAMANKKICKTEMADILKNFS